MINSRIFLMVSVALFCNSIQSYAEELPQWRDDFFSRVEILALLQTLNVQLLSSNSATVVLENWCADHHMASLSKITARFVNDQDKPVSEETRKRLILDFLIGSNIAMFSFLVVLIFYLKQIIGMFHQD